MATRTNTTWWSTPMTTGSQADAATITLSAVTCYAELSRTWVKVQAWVSYQDECTATGATVTEHRCGCSVGGSAYTTVTETDDLTHSAENMGGMLGPFNVTTPFNTTNWPAANASATVTFQAYFDMSTGTTLTTNNIFVIFCMTYEFDDAASTLYQTCMIPLESSTGALAASETQIGSAQIPQFTNPGGWFENTANWMPRQYFFLIEGNESNNTGTTNFVISAGVDGGYDIAFGQNTATLASDRLLYWTFNMLASMPTGNTTHDFYLWISTGGVTRLNNCAVTLYITYEWTPSGSTEIVNSVQLPLSFESPMSGTTTTDISRSKTSIYVEEPSTITLLQSGYKVNFYPGAGNLGGLNSRAGSQAYRAYTHTASVNCGGSSFQQRLDSGSAQGAGMTLARGKNDITIDLYRTDATDLGWGPSGLIYLNYKSGISSQSGGACNHNHTVYNLIGQWDAAQAVTREFTATSVTINEAQYWLNAVGHYCNLFQITTTNFSAGIVLLAELLSGEDAADGWKQIGFRQYITEEAGFNPHYINSSDFYKRYPNDQDLTRMNIETSRKYRMISNIAAKALGLTIFYTYHSIKFAVAGTVSGTGGGTVNLYLIDYTNKRVLDTTTGTTYSFNWFDNTKIGRAHV